MIKIIKKFKDINFDLLFEVYKNVSEKQMEDYYPGLSYEDAVKEYKIEYGEFIEKFLKNPKNFMAINIKEDIYVTAFRLIKINKESTEFYLEALETHSDYLRKGYASELISETLKVLSFDKAIKVKCAIKKTNKGSLRTHEKCGFKIDKNYTVFEDGIIHKDTYSMIYNPN